MNNILVGTLVTISLSNGQVISGKVEKWSPENIILRSMSGAGITIIAHPDRDVIFYHYSEISEEKISEIDQQWDKIITEPMTEEKPKKLAELRILKSRAEKDIIANKLKTHNISDVKKVTYGLPQFLKKPGSE